MPRVKRGKVRTQKRRALLSKTKGYKWGRKNLTRMAKTAVNKAGAYALRDRRAKKRDMRRLWQVQLNAAVRKFDLSYSKFMGLLKAKNIDLDRKVLADMAGNNPELFAKIVETVKN